MSGRDTKFRDSFEEFRARRELRYPYCERCATPLQYTQRLCSVHPDSEPEFRRASGNGTLHSFVEYRASYSADKATPYRLGMIELAEGPRLLGIVQEGAQSAEIGDPVSLGFDSVWCLVATRRSR